MECQRGWICLLEWFNLAIVREVEFIVFDERRIEPHRMLYRQLVIL